MGKSGKKKLKNSSVLDEFHNQISKLKDGIDRLCDICGKIRSKEYFRYKTVNTCIYCYGSKKSSNKIPVIKYNYLNPINLANSPIDEPIDLTQCKYCKSYNIASKGNRGEDKRLECKDCGRSWSVPIDLYDATVNGFKPISLPEDTQNQGSQTVLVVNEEERVDNIIKEIRIRKDKNLPLIISYKDDTASTRVFYDYFIIGKYLKVKGKDHYYTYFLKDIKEIL